MPKFFPVSPYKFGSVTLTRRTNVDEVKYKALDNVDVGKFGKRWKKYKLTPEHTTFRYRKSPEEETSFMFHGNVCVITLLTDEQTKYGTMYFSGVIDFFINMLKRRESLEIKMDEEIEPISYRQYVHLHNADLHEMLNDDWRPNNIARKTFFNVRKVLDCNSIPSALPREDVNGNVIPHQCECSYENEGNVMARVRFAPQHLCAIVYDSANLQAYKAILDDIMWSYLKDAYRCDAVIVYP